MTQSSSGIIKIIFKLNGMPNIKAYFPSFIVMMAVNKQNITIKTDDKRPIYAPYFSKKLFSSFFSFPLIKIFTHINGLTITINSDTTPRIIDSIGFSYHLTFSRASFLKYK